MSLAPVAGKYLDAARPSHAGTVDVVEADPEPADADERVRGLEQPPAHLGAVAHDQRAGALHGGGEVVGGDRPRPGS